MHFSCLLANNDTGITGSLDAAHRSAYHCRIPPPLATKLCRDRYINGPYPNLSEANPPAVHRTDARIRGRVRESLRTPSPSPPPIFSRADPRHPIAQALNSLWSPFFHPRTAHLSTLTLSRSHAMPSYLPSHPIPSQVHSSPSTCLPSCLRPPTHRPTHRLRLRVNPNAHLTSPSRSFSSFLSRSWFACPPSPVLLRGPLPLPVFPHSPAPFLSLPSLFPSLSSTRLPPHLRHSLLLLPHCFPPSHSRFPPSLLLIRVSGKTCHTNLNMNPNTSGAQVAHF
ncbi:hypothetical protein K438DRAFT_1000945 [Mycena galopus ATCC 62051]|nr:hypothetical protein K438DRAFT_1000945 [Mycena galopus ATCC 62051]